MKYCDLHIHSTASDGTYTPEQIVRRAKNFRLDGIAVTDHDSVAAIDETADIAAKLGIDYAPGLEISTADLDGRMHILGYFIDIGNRALEDLLVKQVQARQGRIVESCKVLTEMGCPCTYEDIEEIANGAAIGRPHIAEFLIQSGAVKNFYEAFSRFLAGGKPAYIPKWAPSPQEAIDTIHAAGGLAIAAHPGITEGMMDKLSNLVKWGIDGFEVYYPRHRHEDMERLIVTAQEHDLIITGGSDCHGLRRGEPLLGIFKVRYELMTNLRKRWEERRGELSMHNLK